MSSQMFWLLSYVSLGLALTLGNRATSIHGSSSSSSSSQKPNSGQSLKRQDISRLREERIFLRPGEMGNGLKLENNLGSYRELPIEEGMSFRGEPTTAFQSRTRETEDDADDDEDERNFRDPRKGAFLDEFAIAVLDSLYPRNRDLLVSGKASNLRKENVRFSPSYREELPRTRLKTRSGAVDKKLARAPIYLYRNERIPGNVVPGIERVPEIEPEKSLDSSRTVFSSRERELLDLRETSNLGNEIASSSYQKNETPIKRRDNGMEDRWLENEASSDNENKSNEKRNEQPGRNRNVNSRNGISASSPAWVGNGQQSQNSATPGASIASQFLLRSARGNRQYDVPQIECPASEDGMERFACPTPDRMGRYRCIDDHVLCDGFIDCPEAEDEDRQACMFYKTTKAHLDVLADALLRWARGR